jgi:hypothetical protein
MNEEPYPTYDERVQENKGYWFLITGVVLGLVIGLVISRVIVPVEYVDTAPASLSAEYKSQYRLLIASAYAANRDLVRADARLSLLAEEDVYRKVAEQAQQTMALGGSEADARALSELALALSSGTSGTRPTPTKDE